jgi:hypothetical protein
MEKQQRKRAGTKRTWTSQKHYTEVETQLVTRRKNATAQALAEDTKERRTKREAEPRRNGIKQGRKAERKGKKKVLGGRRFLERVYQLSILKDYHIERIILWLLFTLIFYYY